MPKSAKDNEGLAMQRNKATPGGKRAMDDGSSWKAMLCCHHNGCNSLLVLIS